MTLFLMLPGSPIPDWLILLTPLAVLFLSIYGGEHIHKWYKNRMARHHHNKESEFIQNQDIPEQL